MGDRYRLDFMANLKTNQRSDLEQVRAVMAKDADEARKVAANIRPQPESEFFGRGTFAHFCRSESAYCPGASVREWSAASSRSTPQKAEHRITIIGQTKYKDEIDQFLEWVHPAIDASEFEYLGSILYDGFEMPTQLYYSTEGVSQVGPTEFDHFRRKLMKYLYE